MTSLVSFDRNPPPAHVDRVFEFLVAPPPRYKYNTLIFITFKPIGMYKYNKKYKYKTQCCQQREPHSPTMDRCHPQWPVR